MFRNFRGVGKGNTMTKKFNISLPIGVLVLIAGMFLFRNFPVDSSYIHLHYARHLKENGHFYYNYGYSVNAVTSPLWIISISIGARLFHSSDYYMIAQILNAFFILLAAYLFFKLTLKIFESKLASNIVFLIFCLHPFILRWAINCVEFPLTVFLVVAILSVYSDMLGASKFSKTKNILLGLLIGLSILARPENATLAAILFMAIFFKKGFKLKSLPFFIISAFMCVLVISLWIGYCRFEFGSVIPTSFLTKSRPLPDFAHFFVHTKTNSKLLIASHPVELAALLGCIILLVYRKRCIVLRDIIFSKKRLSLELLLFPCLVFLFYNLKGILMYSRFLVNLSPFVILLGGLFVEKTAYFIGNGEKTRKILLTSFLTIYLAYSAIFARYFIYPKSLVAVNRPRNNILYSISKDLDKLEKEREIKVALTEVGIIKYFAARPRYRFLIDLTGLISPEYYEYYRRGDTTGIINQSKPDYIVLMEWEEKALLKDGMTINVANPTRSKLKCKITHLKTYALLRDDDRSFSIHQMPFLKTSYETYRVGGFQSHFYSLYKLSWGKKRSD